jgi:hypothetical protein
MRLTIGAESRPINDDELDLGIGPLDRAVIAALPVRVDRAHKIQVRRHRLRPFLCEAFGGSTSLFNIGVVRLSLDQALREDPDGC